MATFNRARVCTIGTQEDMIRLCRLLLDNCQWFDEPEEDQPDLTLEQLIALIGKHARLEGGDESSFCYPMIASHPYGDAIASTCRLSIRRHASGLYLARFSYDSETAFQHEDWLALHRDLKLLPMLAIYANDDFGLEKGMKIYAGGRVGDDWNRMGETFLYLIAGYEEGYPPEEAVARLRKLRKTLEREDFDLSIAGLLRSCIDNLTELNEDVADEEAVAQDMQSLRQEKDFESLFQLYLRLIEAELWEIEHVDRHLACLEAVLAAWVEAEGEDEDEDEDWE
ncbi:MAG: hypothetical protein IJB81_07410 [Clostridia bacterium]|nr:hypothetical protein [Clostridia bacterium]